MFPPFYRAAFILSWLENRKGQEFPHKLSQVSTVAFDAEALFFTPFNSRGKQKASKYIVQNYQKRMWRSVCQCQKYRNFLPDLSPDGSTGADDWELPLFSLLLLEMTGVLSASSSSDSEAARALNALGTDELGEKARKTLVELENNTWIYFLNLPSRPRWGRPRRTSARRRPRVEVKATLAPLDSAYAVQLPISLRPRRGDRLLFAAFATVLAIRGIFADILWTLADHR